MILDILSKMLYNNIGDTMKQPTDEELYQKLQVMKEECDRSKIIEEIKTNDFVTIHQFMMLGCLTKSTEIMCMRDPERFSGGMTLKQMFSTKERMHNGDKLKKILYPETIKSDT